MASAKGARTAAVWGSGLLQDTQKQVFGELGQGYDAAQGFLGQAGDLYKGMTAAGQPGLDQYNKLTLGSGEDITRQLEGLGGFQFERGQLEQAINRRAAAAGMSASGNADHDMMAAISGYSRGALANERAALNPYLGMYTGGVQGQAGVLGQQAGTATDYYTSRANTLDDTTKNIVGLGSQALLAGDQAKSQNQANMINIGTGLLKGATSLFTGGLGGIGGGFMKVGG